uniref:Uncharacterized protein n=1 Tax=Arundo donax TaxID=35708 RepID=A0A0A9GX58_ARUDO
MSLGEPRSGVHDPAGMERRSRLKWDVNPIRPRPSNWDDIPGPRVVERGIDPVSCDYGWANIKTNQD